DFLVEHVPAAGVGTPPYDEHAHALGQLGERLAQILVELEPFGELLEVECGLLLTGERLPTRGTEVRSCLVLVAASAASHPERVLRSPWPRRESLDMEARSRVQPEAQVEGLVAGPTLT